MSEDELDKKGKDIFISLLSLYNCLYYLTKYKYDRVDIYFGNSSVGEIKYRLKYYSTFIIEEDKLNALKSLPSTNKYYIVCLPNNIFLWRTETILKFLPLCKTLPTDLTKLSFKTKIIRFLPVSAADFHFKRDSEKSLWKLIKFN